MFKHILPLQAFKMRLIAQLVNTAAEAPSV